MASPTVSEFLGTTVPFSSATSSMLRFLRESYTEGSLDGNHDHDLLDLRRVGGCRK